MPMTDEQVFELTKKIKRKLNITWVDPDTDARVSDVMNNAIVMVRRKIGIPDSVDFDFTAPGQEQNLLLAWCLYEWNHATDEFDANYSNDLLQMRQKWAVIGDGSTEDGDDDQV